MSDAKPSNSPAAPCPLLTKEMAAIIVEDEGKYLAEHLENALNAIASGAAVVVPADTLRDAERMAFIERTQAHITFGASLKYGEGWYVHVPRQRLAPNDYAHETLRGAIDAVIQQQDRTQGQGDE